MLRDANLNSISRGWIPTRTLRSPFKLHTFLVGFVKCAWHETSGTWNEKKDKLFFMRVGLASLLDASSGLREVARTEPNTLYMANDLGDPRITSLRTDEKQVAGEL
jgi:hypothetical protein